MPSHPPPLLSLPRHFISSTCACAVRYACSRGSERGNELTRSAAAALFPLATREDVDRPRSRPSVRPGWDGCNLHLTINFGYSEGPKGDLMLWFCWR